MSLSCTTLIEENYRENKWGSVALLYGHSSEMKLHFQHDYKEIDFATEC